MRRPLDAIDVQRIHRAPLRVELGASLELSHVRSDARNQIADLLLVLILEGERHEDVVNLVRADSTLARIHPTGIMAFVYSGN